MTDESELLRREKIRRGINKRYSLIGKTFGNLSVIAEFVENKRRYCVCKCSCGKKTVTLAQSLKSGHTISCGCSLEKWRSKNNRIYKERLYRCYKSMIDRCYNKKNKRYLKYGGRDINVCEKWKNNYQAFKNWALSNGYSDNLTLERKDVNGNYSPENCCWIDIKKQSNNKTNTVKITYNEETRTLRDWCEMLDLSYKAIYFRLRKGWDVEKMLTLQTPTGFRGTKNAKKRKKKQSR